MTRNRCVAVAAVLLMACVGCNSGPTSSSTGPVIPGSTVSKEKERAKTGERGAPVEALTVPGGGGKSK